MMEPATARADDGDSVDYIKFMKDTLLWTNTVRSAFYLVSGTALLLTVDYMLGHNIPFLVGEERPHAVCVFSGRAQLARGDPRVMCA